MTSFSYLGKIIYLRAEWETNDCLLTLLDLGWVSLELIWSGDLVIGKGKSIWSILILEGCSFGIAESMSWSTNIFLHIIYEKQAFRLLADHWGLLLDVLSWCFLPRTALGELAPLIFYCLVLIPFLESEIILIHPSLSTFRERSSPELLSFTTSHFLSIILETIIKLLNATQGCLVGALWCTPFFSTKPTGNNFLQLSPHNQD